MAGGRAHRPGLTFDSVPLTEEPATVCIKLGMPPRALDQLIVEILCRCESSLQIMAEYMAEYLRWDDATQDNATDELLGFVKAGDRAGFDALASCLMPAHDAAACWIGTRARLGLTR